ncbi:HR1 repeat Rho-binding protein [Colletotrichum acutatum]
MNQLEQLQANGVDKYADLVTFFEKEGIEASFYAPSARFLVQQIEEPDVAIWLIDASQQDSWKASLGELRSLLSDGRLRPKEKLLILINKMDLVDWSAEVWNETVKQAADATLQASSTLIPISALKGDNILDVTKQVASEGTSRGISQQTLMQLLA